MGTQSLQYDATLRCSPKRKFQSHAISTPDEPPSKKTLLFNSPEGSVNSSSLGIPKNSGRVARSTPDVPSLEIPPTVDAHDGFEEGERQTEDLVETALVNNANNAAMSSSGDPTQLDGQALLELQNASAAKIQRYWKALQLRRLEARESFCRTLSTLVQNVDWNCFGPDSDFLRQLLFFFNAKRGEDVDMLCKICDILLLYVRSDGDLVTLFAGGVDSSRVKSVVVYRLRKLAFICLLSTRRGDFESCYLEWSYFVYFIFNCVMFDWASSEIKPIPFHQLLEFAVCLMNPNFQWSCEIVEYLQMKKVNCFFRGVIGALLQSERHTKYLDCSSALSKILTLVASHVGNYSCHCSSVDPRWSFSSQILSIPSLWHNLPDFKKAFCSNGFISNYILEIASCADVLPTDILANHPGQACLLANVLETATWILSEPDFAPESRAEIIGLCTSLLDGFPKITSPIDRTYVDGTIPIDNDANYYLDVDLQRHILTLFQHLVNAAVSGILSIDFSDSAGLSSTELQFVGSISFFLHGMLHSSITDGIMTELVHTTEIVPALWNFIKSCHTNDKWQFFSKYCSQLLPDAPGWLLPLSIFCPMYSHILQFMDIVELKKSERYVSLEDLPSLVFILKEALWELLLTIPLQSSSLQTTCSPLDNKKMLTQVLKSSVMTGLCELLIQLEKWNNMDQFVPPIGFCSTKAISDEFASQALIVGTHEAEIIRLAPFLVPFDTRLEIFQLRLEADHLLMGNSRQYFGSRTLEIRRTNLLKDAFNNISLLSAEDLKGRIQIVFFNEHGMKEAGVDAGGIFREFMNIITQSAFSLESRLFKETADHLLYPNPESKLAHADHLQYFHFLGVLLGKAMYEGITVCLPFTIFFLRKLKQKETFFNDLFSLDPELYRTLVNLKPKNSDDLSYIYFIAPDGKELFPGGARMHVTAHNVTTYMHLVANYQLNCQNRVQTAQFVRGFQQLIPKEWTDMFNEHEFQLLISGSLSLNVEDLQLNTNYSGEYHMDHVVIVMFWNVLRKFSGRDQERFLIYGDDPSRLPLASTCFNQLHLPPYQTEEQMHAKLIQALSSKSGFDLM
ncbi:hypothetical protein ACQ4PT_012191 [Festuca glaucescens]